MTATYTDESLGEVLDKVKWESVPAGQIAEIASLLRDGEFPERQRYTALHIIARAEPQRYEDLIARFLDESSDPMLARLAIQALCGWLDQFQRYKSTVVSIIRGASWVGDDEVHQMAVAQAGTYLATHDDLPLARDLLRLAENDGESAIKRDDAARALARALGDDPRTFPSPSKIQDPSSPWSRSVINRAAERFR